MSDTYSVVAADGQAYGPVDEAGLTQWAKEGRVNAVTTIRCDPAGNPVQAGSLPFLAAVFHGAAAPQPYMTMAMPSSMPPGTPGAMQMAMPMSWQLVPPNSPMASMHQLTKFSVGLMILLHYVTFGIFPMIWLNLMHDKMPRLRHDDPSAGKAIGFMFIPFFNLYWVFFTYIRLCNRIAEQRIMRRLPDANVSGLGIAMCICMLIPYVNFFVGWLILGPIFFGLLQSRVNELVDATCGMPRF